MNQKSAEQPDAVTLSLSTPPPSTNAMFANRGRSAYQGKRAFGRIQTRDYAAWLEAALWEIKFARSVPILGNVRVSLAIQRPSTRSDLDNRIKGALDAVVKAGVIEDDRHVVELAARWSNDVQGCQIVIESA